MQILFDLLKIFILLSFNLKSKVNKTLIHIIALILILANGK
jgi:hypothetical protein